MSEMTTQERADWLVYSRQHNAWWRPKAAGYCTHIDGAGRFTKEKAEACASSRSITDPGSPPEFMVPAPEAYEAIAARLKELEEARETIKREVTKIVGRHHESCRRWDYLHDQPCDCAHEDQIAKRAILDAAREVE